MEWLEKAHSYQVPPQDTSWDIWMLMAGRGAGKTACASNEVGWINMVNPGNRWLVTAPTSGDIRDTCFEGDSGLMNTIPTRFIKQYNKSLHELVLTNGSLIKGIPASEPERYRGPQWNGAWYDELAAMDYAKSAWDLSQLSVRLGKRTRTIITTTPKPIPLLRELIAREGDNVIISRASSYDNLLNLSSNFKDQLLRFEGTQQGRQEIHGELIDMSESGIIKKSWLKLFPADKDMPHFLSVLVSMDTAMTDSTQADRTACTVWGVFRQDGITNAMLLDCWADRIAFPDLRIRAKEAWLAPYDGVKPSVFLIEDKGSGISLRQDLQREGIPVTPYNPGRADKVQRAHLVSPLAKDGFIWIPESKKSPGKPMSWSTEMLDELAMFPNDEHDDYVDSCT
jgi:predicted phage terminase large subunit-like protein